MLFPELEGFAADLRRKGHFYEASLSAPPSSLVFGVDEYLGGFVIPKPRVMEPLESCSKGFEWLSWSGFFFFISWLILGLVSFLAGFFFLFLSLGILLPHGAFEWVVVYRSVWMNVLLFWSFFWGFGGSFWVLRPLWLRFF